MKSQFWLRPSLARQIAVRMSVLAIAAIFLLTYLFAKQDWENSRNELEEQGELLMDTTALALRDPLYNLQVDELNELASRITENQRVTLLVFYDSKGTVLVDSKHPGMMFSQDVDPLGKTLVALPNDTTYHDWQSTQLVVGQSVHIGNQTVGAIALGLSTKPLAEKIRELTIQSLVIALGIILIGGFLTFGTARLITTPLSNLANVANEMRSGNLSIRAPQPKSNDEIGQLANAFNQMAESIQQRQREMSDLADGLERTVNERTAALQEQTKILEEMAVTDPLTQAYNRRQFFKLAKIEMERALQNHLPLSVIVMDADHYKRVNDTFGHQIGDLVLVKLVEICKGIIRKTDVFARYGGEEFVILMPETDSETASQVAERIREKIDLTNLPVNGHNVHFTISLGISTLDPTHVMNFDSLLTQADRALYRSKRTGRNRVTTWMEEKHILS
jgi:diguanylate cyclase (GGDEF)-like protein